MSFSSIPDASNSFLASFSVFPLASASVCAKKFAKRIYNKNNMIIKLKCELVISCMKIIKKIFLPCDVSYYQWLYVEPGEHLQ